MMLEIHARYLTIEWREPGKPRDVACAANPIEIERVGGGGWELELQIFRQDHAWLGVRLDGAPPDLRPIWLSPDGERRPLTAVSDAKGATWWIPALEWDDGSFCAI